MKIEKNMRKRMIAILENAHFTGEQDPIVMAGLLFILRVLKKEV